MSDFNLYPGGSRWWKWDLHVHTPASIIQEFGGDTEDVWESYLKDLEALPPEYKVIGINDYFLIDGYERVRKEKYENGRLQNIDLLLPVLEFRLKIFAGNKSLSKINFHVIFSDKVEPDTIRRFFLDKLKVDYPGWNSGITTLEELIAFGKHCKQEVPEDKREAQSDRKFGFNSLTYDYGDVLAVLEGNNQYFFENGIPQYLTAIGRTEWSDMRWDSAPADKRMIINKADFVFCASDTLKQFETSLENLQKDEVNDKLFHFSDAHYLSSDQRRYSMRIGDSYTWIKGNPTFEGLRQTKFEFGDRVKISPTRPYNRNKGTIIDTITFFSPQNRFSETPIKLNPYLNVIIGGYSMGKSMLLHHLGKSIDPSELVKAGEKLKAKGEDSSFLLRKYNFVSQELDSQFNAAIKWVDEKTDLLNSEDQGTGRKIMYFPQGYIGTLAKPEHFKSKFELDKYITEIIRQEQGIDNDYLKFQDLYREYDVKMESQVEESYRISKELADAEKRLKDYGEPESIEAYILELKDELKELKEISGLDEKEQEEYDNIVGIESSQKSRQNEIESDQRNLEQFFRESQDTASKIEKRYSQLLNELNDSHVKEKVQETLAFCLGLLAQLDKARAEILDLDSGLISAIQKQIQTELSTLDASKQKYLPKLQNEEAIKTLEGKIAAEARKIQDHAQQLKIRNSVRKDFEEKKKALIDLYKENYAAYIFIRDSLNGNPLRNNQEIELEAEIDYHYGYLEKNFQPIVNKKSFSSTSIGGNSLSDLVERPTLGDVEEHFSLVEAFFEDAVNGNLPLNGKRGFNDALKFILIDKFYINWRIIYGGDQLEYMSPGKANLVILKLLIEMSNDEWPILLDQPEDHLDNRSIYNDLVKFLKKKKNERQIIIVTHNPNLLVGADAENVIVANRKGEGRENYSFEYVTGAIEHSFPEKDGEGLERMGIREHICNILEGGKDAFKKREGRYGFSAE